MLRELLNPRQLLPTLSAGLITGILGVIVGISFGVLIFSGDLASFVGQGIGFGLVGAAVITAVAALTSSYPGSVSTPQDSPAPILALMAAAIARQMAAAPPQEKFLTVVAAIMLSGIVVGLVMMLLGRFRLGELVRYIPYPVIGGFLAGTGWLLVVGGLGVMVDIPVEANPIAHLLDPRTLPLWLPGFIFACIVTLVLRRYSHFLVLPALLVGATLLFYGFFFLTGVSIEQMKEMGLLLRSFPSGGLWHPFNPADLGAVNWSVIADQAFNIVPMILVSTIGLLLNASGTEIAVKQDISLNRELLSAGLANILTGLVGGFVGYPALSFTALGYRLKANSRLIGLTKALFTIVVLLVGASTLTYLPKQLLGGLIMFLGLGFLVEWLYDTRSKLSRTDYGVIVLILLAIAIMGYLRGVLVGIGVAVVLFVVDYSQINVIKHAATGTTRQSKVIRSAEERNLLLKNGYQLLILELEGFIFFGTANRLLDHIRGQVGQSERSTQFIVLDFREVNRLDLSAVMSFLKLKDLTETRGIELFFTNVSPVLEAQLQRTGMSPDAHFHFLDDIDRGIELCEDQILKAGGISVSESPVSMMQQLERMFPQLDCIPRLVSYFSGDEFPAGACLARQGDTATELFFVESGLLSIQLELGDGQMSRLRTATAGAIVGEVGAYLGTTRTASIFADKPSVVYRLPVEALTRMRQEDPEAASVFHEFIARLIAERLSDTTQALEALLK